MIHEIPFRKKLDISAHKPRIPDVSANRISMTRSAYSVGIYVMKGKMGVYEQILAFVCCCKCYFLWEQKKRQTNKKVT